MVVKRRFERIYKTIACTTDIKFEDNPENKKIFNYGFKHNKTSRSNNCIIIGCESDVRYENQKLFNFWSKKLINKEIEKTDFKLPGWSFMTLIKRNNFFEFKAYVFKRFIFQQKCSYI